MKKRIILKNALSNPFVTTAKMAYSKNCGFAKLYYQIKQVQIETKWTGPPITSWQLTKNQIRVVGTGNQKKIVVVNDSPSPSVES